LSTTVSMMTSRASGKRSATVSTDASLRLEPLGAGIGRLVEGFVELCTLRVDDPRRRIVPGGGRGSGHHDDGEGDGWSPEPLLPQLRENPQKNVKNYRSQREYPIRIKRLSNHPRAEQGGLQGADLGL
jgi:hypothetical protein